MATIATKKVCPGRGLGASRDNNPGLAGLGGSAIAKEAEGAAALPEQGPAHTLGQQRHEICGVAANSSSG